MRLIFRVLTLVILMSVPGVAHALEVSIEPALGAAGFTKDAKFFAGPGGIAAGRLLLIPQGNLLITFTGSLGLHSEGKGDDIASGAVGLTLLAGPRLSSGNSLNGKTSFELGIEVGRGAIAWDYTRQAEFVLFMDGDALGAWILQPEATLVLPVSDDLAMTVNASYATYHWDDESNGGFDATGFEGNSFRGIVGLRIRL